MENKQTGFHINKESVSKLFPRAEIDILGYESPINIIIGCMRTEQENNIYKVIRDYGVAVDKEELIKALQYDREQYEKGYINGYNAKASEVIEEAFEQIRKKAFPHYYGGIPVITRADIDGIEEELKKKYTEERE